jgi:hypothetical protein
MMMMTMLMGWDYVFELLPWTGLLFILKWRKSTENHAGMSAEENWFIHQSSSAILPAESSGSSQEERANSVLRSILVHTCNLFFTCRKILRHGALGFTSFPKEGVLRIFIALKNPFRRPDLNPITFRFILLVGQMTQDRICGTRSTYRGRGMFHFILAVKPQEAT